MSKDIYVKTGDKVRCISRNMPELVHTPYLKYNHIYTVMYADSDCFVLDGIGGRWANPINITNIFELYQENKTFNKGDKVKFIGKIGNYYEIGWADPMKKYIGQVGEVLSDKVLKDNSVKVVFEDEEYWYIHVDSLELVEDNPSMEQTLKKLQEDIIKISGLPSKFFQYSNMTCVSLDAPIFTNKKRSFKKL